MLKAYKYRLYPSKQQEEYFTNCFGCARFIYNQMLNDKIGHYKETKQMLKNTPAQYKEEFTFLKEVDSLALANAQQESDEEPQTGKKHWRCQLVRIRPSIGIQSETKRTNHYQSGQVLSIQPNLFCLRTPRRQETTPHS